ncbi:10401_t:CDS:2 [Scutellospora calospora]|uniref:10401_t:CDS:1 n=1 Tax=Scutellospora calospora TaxID=85575 RepID=A0ACA9JWI8_9GLOM|nr:10401_t:CDS:2 [Scutellospora calospora]
MNNFNKYSNYSIRLDTVLSMKLILQPIELNNHPLQTLLRQSMAFCLKSKLEDNLNFLACYKTLLYVECRNEVNPCIVLSWPGHQSLFEKVFN